MFSLVHREIGIEPEALAHVGQMVAHPRGIGGHVHPGHPHLSGVGGHDPGQDSQGGGLAGAVRAHQAEDLAVGHLQVESVQGGEVAEAPGQAPGVNGGLVVIGGNHATRLSLAFTHCGSLARMQSIV